MKNRVSILILLLIVFYWLYGKLIFITYNFNPDIFSYTESIDYSLVFSELNNMPFSNYFDVFDSGDVFFLVNVIVCISIFIKFTGRLYQYVKMIGVAIPGITFVFLGWYGLFIFAAGLISGKDGEWVAEGWYMTESLGLISVFSAYFWINKIRSNL